MRMLGTKNSLALLRIFIISKTMAARGDSQTHEETVLLIELLGDDHFQQQLDTTPKRNIDIFRRVCQDIKDRLPGLSSQNQNTEDTVFSNKTPK